MVKKKRTRAPRVRPRKTKEGYSPTLLLILDGFGIGDLSDPGNAITPQSAPNIFRYIKRYPTTLLKAHGIDVGLFPDQQGNSEAGHLNIGAGRVVKQDLVIISDAIKDGTFFKNESLHQGLLHAQKHKSDMHIMGLITNGQSAHSNPEHIYALLKYFRSKKQKNVFIHLFTDGRDSPMHGAVSFLKELRKHMKNGEKIASISGRFYAMDRNKIWSRTEKAYSAIVCGKGQVAKSAEDAIAQAYNRGETDEYVLPTVIQKNGKPVAMIGDNDVVCFFNARSDRARQITKAFVQKDFQKENPNAFKRKKYSKNIRFVAMTDFGPDLPGIFTAFPSPDVKNSLAKAIGESRKQLYISETEKYAHVTYFINGGYSEPINGEDREVIKSGSHYSYIENPEMHCRQITDTVLKHLQQKKYDFVAINFPNADMLGHTGDIGIAKKGIKFMDSQVRRLVDEVLKKGGHVIITADHGNAEHMFDKKTGEKMVEHTINPVPFIVIGHKKKIVLKKGRLADIAPTLLKILDIKKPKEMKGKVLY